MKLRIRPWAQGQKSFYNKQKFQTSGEEGFCIFPTIFEGADSKSTCYQVCIPAVFSAFQKQKLKIYTALSTILANFGPSRRHAYITERRRNMIS